MKIKLHSNAADIYRSYCMTPDRAGMFSKSYFEKLKEVEGKTLEVDTRYLFQDQFNVKESDLRIMAQSVEEVINDLRPNIIIDNYTGEQYKSIEDIPEESKTKERRFFLAQFYSLPHGSKVALCRKIAEF